MNSTGKSHHKDWNTKSLTEEEIIQQKIINLAKEIEEKQKELTRLKAVWYDNHFS